MVSETEKVGCQLKKLPYHKLIKKGIKNTNVHTCPYSLFKILVNNAAINKILL